ncbi:MAG: Replication factor C small subunit, partial [archaeon]|nr:Replication factor C small subunit [archaeon]
CVVFRFKPLSSKDVEEKLRDVAKKENVQMEDAAYKAIIYVSSGDMRKAINVLQAATALGGKVTEQNVYEVASKARPEEVKEMIKLALAGKFLEARAMLDKLMYEYGMSGEDVILQLHRELISMPEEEVSGNKKINLIDTIGEYNFRLVEGANERVQLEALLAQFMKAEN